MSLAGFVLVGSGMAAVYIGSTAAVYHKGKAAGLAKAEQIVDRVLGVSKR